MWVQFVKRMQKKKFAYYVTLLKVGVSEEEFVHAFKSHLEMESLPSDISYDTLSGYLFNETLRRLLAGRKNEEEDESESEIFTDSSGSRGSDNSDGDDSDGGDTDGDDSDDDDNDDDDNDDGDNDNGNDNNSDTTDSDNAFNPDFFNGDPRNMNREQREHLVNQLQMLLMQRALLESLLEQRQQEQRQQNGNDVVIEEVNDESDSVPSVNSVDSIVCHKHTIHTGSLQSCCAPPRRGRKTGRARASP